MRPIWRAQARIRWKVNMLGGTSHITLPDMNLYIKMNMNSYTDINSYIRKYNFIYPVTNEFIHPGQCMNSYVFDPCLVHKKWPL